MFKIWELLSNKNNDFTIQMVIDSNEVDEFLENLDENDFPF
jgi:hypothetical protein